MNTADLRKMEHCATSTSKSNQPKSCNSEKNNSESEQSLTAGFKSLSLEDKLQNDDEAINQVESKIASLNILENKPLSGGHSAASSSSLLKDKLPNNVPVDQKVTEDSDFPKNKKAKVEEQSKFDADILEKLANLYAKYSFEHEDDDDEEWEIYESDQEHDSSGSSSPKMIGIVAKLKIIHNLDFDFVTSTQPKTNSKKSNKNNSEQKFNVARGETTNKLDESKKQQNTLIDDKQRLFSIFKSVKNAIKCGNLIDLKELIITINKTFNKNLLCLLYSDNDNPIRDTHLITLACKYRKPELFYYLLYETDILQYLPNEGSVVEKSYTQAFSETILSQNFEMMESLYDYLCGDIHWPVSKKKSIAHVINNLNLIKKILKESQIYCEKHSKEPKLPVALYCLVKYNDFQLKLYEQLQSLDIRVNKNDSNADIQKNEVKAIINLIGIVFKVYNDAVNVKEVDSDFYNYYLFGMLHRKLDSSIALLILNNLHLLKKNLELPKNAYHDIECALYYFLYEASDNWSLYLRRNKIKEKELKNTYNLDVPADGTRFLNQPIIFYTWNEFKKSISKFVSILDSINIDENMRHKIPKEEINTLSLLPYIRDDYSLKKMLNYMKILSKLDFEHDKERSSIVVQRVIQVLGEFVKHSATLDTVHLSKTTRAILQEEIPKSVVKILEDLRDSSLSRARDGALLRRIVVEQDEPMLFEYMIADLFEIKNAIKEVIHLYKPILEKSIYKSAIRLLVDAEEILDNDDNEEEWAELFGVPIPASGFVSANITHLREMREIANRKNIITAAKKTPKYTPNILLKLEEMEKHNTAWLSLKSDLTSIVDINSEPDYPNNESIKNIKQNLENEIIKSQNNTDKTSKPNTKDLKLILTKTKSKLNSIRDFTNDWDDIINVLRFFVEDIGIFENNPMEIKHSWITSAMDICKRSRPDADGICEVKRLTRWLEDEAQNYNKQAVSPDPHKYEYTALKTLAVKLKQKNFLTNSESDFLLKNISFICHCTETASKRCDYCHILQKIKNNDTLTVLEHRKILSLNLNELCKTTLENLVIGFKRKNNILECLLNRAQLLNKLLGDCRDQKQLVHKYKCDDFFRYVLEFLICDVMNAFMEGWLQELANVRFSQILSDYPLRNVIEHGNPLLEVVGSFLDPDDFPNALISFALNFLEDETYLKDLYKLLIEDVDRQSVRNSTNLTPEQLELTNNFKGCGSWEIYIKLLPAKK